MLSKVIKERQQRNRCQKRIMAWQRIEKRRLRRVMAIHGMSQVYLSLKHAAPEFQEIAKAQADAQNAIARNALHHYNVLKNNPLMTKTEWARFNP